MKELDLLIRSAEYAEVTQKVISNKNIKIIDDYYEILLEDSEEYLRKASLNVQDLKNILENDDLFGNYSISRYNIINDNDNDEEEYPENEQVSKEEKSITTEVHGLSRNFLIDILIEYYILKNEPDKLNEYIKTIGIPNSKSFAKKLKEIYNSINKK